MRFFTPELLCRFGSDDDQIAVDAQQELERRSDEYSRQLHEMEPKLPERFRELLGHFYLHDARIIDHSNWDRPQGAPVSSSGSKGMPESRWIDHEETRLLSFCIALQLDAPPRDLVVLQYRSVVVEEVCVHRSVGQDGCPYLEWQYDEVELIRTDRRTKFRHSILFTSGFELQLRFRDFDFATLRPMATWLNSEETGELHCPNAAIGEAS